MLVALLTFSFFGPLQSMLLSKRYGAPLEGGAMRSHVEVGKGNLPEVQADSEHLLNSGKSFFHFKVKSVQQVQRMEAGSRYPVSTLELKMEFKGVTLPPSPSAVEGGRQDRFVVPPFSSPQWRTQMQSMDEEFELILRGSGSTIPYHDCLLSFLKSQYVEGLYDKIWKVMMRAHKPFPYDEYMYNYGSMRVVLEYMYREVQDQDPGATGEWLAEYLFLRFSYLREAKDVLDDAQRQFFLIAPEVMESEEEVPSSAFVHMGMWPLRPWRIIRQEKRAGLNFPRGLLYEEYHDNEWPLFHVRGALCGEHASQWFPHTSRFFQFAEGVISALGDQPIRSSFFEIFELHPSEFFQASDAKVKTQLLGAEGTRIVYQGLMKLFGTMSKTPQSQENAEAFLFLDQLVDFKALKAVSRKVRVFEAVIDLFCFFSEYAFLLSDLDSQGEPAYFDQMSPLLRPTPPPPPPPLQPPAPARKTSQSSGSGGKHGVKMGGTRVDETGGSGGGMDPLTYNRLIMGSGPLSFGSQFSGRPSSPFPPALTPAGLPERTDPGSTDRAPGRLPPKPPRRSSSRNQVIEASSSQGVERPSDAGDGTPRSSAALSASRRERSPSSSSSTFYGPGDDRYLLKYGRYGAPLLHFPFNTIGPPPQASKKDLERLRSPSPRKSCRTSFLQLKKRMLGLSLLSKGLRVGMGCAQDLVSSRPRVAAVAGLAGAGLAAYRFGPNRYQVMQYFINQDSWRPKDRGDYDSSNEGKVVKGSAFIGISGTGNTLELKHSFTFLSWDASVDRGRQGWTYLREKQKRRPNPSNRVEAADPIHGKTTIKYTKRGQRRVKAATVTLENQSLFQQSSAGLQVCQGPGGVFRSTPLGLSTPVSAACPAASRNSRPMIASFLQKKRVHSVVPYSPDYPGGGPVHPGLTLAIPSLGFTLPPASAPASIKPSQVDMQLPKIFGAEEEKALELMNRDSPPLAPPPPPVERDQLMKFPFYLPERIGETSAQGLRAMPIPKWKTSNFEELKNTGKEFMKDVIETFYGKLTPSPLGEAGKKALEITGDEVEVGVLTCGGKETLVGQLAGMLQSSGLAGGQPSLISAVNTISKAKVVLQPGQGAFNDYQEYVAKAYLPLKAQVSKQLAVIVSFLAAHNVLDEPQIGENLELVYEIPEVLCALRDFLSSRSSDSLRLVREKRLAAFEKLGKGYGVQPSSAIPRAVAHILLLRSANPFHLPSPDAASTSPLPEAPRPGSRPPLPSAVSRQDLQGPYVLSGASTGARHELSAQIRDSQRHAEAIR